MKRLLVCLPLLALMLTACPAEDENDGDGGGGGGSGVALSIDTTSVPDTTIGAAYTVSLDGSGGTGSGYTWNVVTGRLPDGLTLAPSGTPSTTIAGTPVETGLFSFTVALTDSGAEITQRDFSLAVKGRWFVYHADQDTAGTDELFAVDVSTTTYGSPVKLNPTLATGGEVPAGSSLPVNKDLFSPGGRSLVFAAETVADGVEELWTVDMTGTTIPAPVKVNATLPAGGSTDEWWWSHDGNWLAYTADQATLGTVELWMVDVSTPGAPGTPVRMNGSLTAGGSVYNFEDGSSPFSPDGARIAYVAEQDTVGVAEVYAATLTAGTLGARVKVSSAMLGGSAGASLVKWAPDGQSLVYVADGTTVGTTELYWVDFSTGSPSAAVKVSSTIAAAGGNVDDGDVLFAPDSSGLCYFADADVDGQVELFYVDLTAVTPQGVKINGALTNTGMDVNNYLWAPDSTWVLYLSDQDVLNEDALYSVAIVGGTPGGSVKVSQTFAAGGDVFGGSSGAAYTLSADGQYLVYRAEEAADGETDLFMIYLGGTSPGTAMRINSLRPAPTADVNSFFISPDSSQVIFHGDVLVAGQDRLFSAGLTPTGPTTQQGPINATVTSTGNPTSGFTGFGWNATGSQFWYRGDCDTDSVIEVYVGEFGGAVTKVNGTMNGDANSAEFQR